MAKGYEHLSSERAGLDSSEAGDGIQAWGQVLYESGSMLGHVYFPTTAIFSLLYVMENGASAESAVGISLFMGGESTPSRAVVQSAGQGFSPA